MSHTVRTAQIKRLKKCQEKPKFKEPTTRKVREVGPPLSCASGSPLAPGLHVPVQSRGKHSAVSKQCGMGWAAADLTGSAAMMCVCVCVCVYRTQRWR